MTRYVCGEETLNLIHALASVGWIGIFVDILIGCFLFTHALTVIRWSTRVIVCALWTLFCIVLCTLAHFFLFVIGIQARLFLFLNNDVTMRPMWIGGTGTSVHAKGS